MIDLFSSIITGRKDDHRTLFLRNEWRSIIGPAGRNIRMLFLFTLFAFFAVTFAQAGLKYLEKRMDNPFVNWLTFTVSADISDDYESTMKHLDGYRRENRFTMDEVGGLMRYTLSFRDSEGRPLDKVKGRTFIHPQDGRLLEKVFSDDNLIDSHIPSLDPSSWSTSQRKRGVVLTRDVVEAIGCERPQTVYAQYLDYYVELEVLAVVQSLPDRALFMTSYEMYWGLVNSSNTEYDISDHRPSETISFLVARREDATLDDNDIDRIEVQLSDMGIELVDHTLSDPDTRCAFDARLDLQLGTSVDQLRFIAVSDVVVEELEWMHPFLIEQYAWYEPGDLSQTDQLRLIPGSEKNPYSSITLHFAELDSIRAFRQLLLNEQEIDISLEQIESRENFHLVSIITSILAFSLGVFTLISIILFVSNVLEAHLERIKTNLGTFMAFGLSADFLAAGYNRLIIGMLSSVSLVVILIIGLLDLFRVPYRLLSLFGMNLKADLSEAFTVWSSWLFVLIALCLLVTSWNCRRLVRKILRHDPSDLIYDRTH